MFQRDERGWKIKTRFLTFHPVSYGVGSLARLSIGLHDSGRRFMVHYFPKCELPQKYHDHPFPFVTLMLFGEYLDISIDRTGEVIDRLRPGSVRFRRASHRHKTYVLKPVITIVLRGREVRHWCEGNIGDWKCEGEPANFRETLGQRH